MQFKWRVVTRHPSGSPRSLLEALEELHVELVAELGSARASDVTLVALPTADDEAKAILFAFGARIPTFVSDAVEHPHQGGYLLLAACETSIPMAEV